VPGSREVLRLLQPYTLLLDVGVRSSCIMPFYDCVACCDALVFAKVHRLDMSPRAGVVYGMAHALEEALRLVYPFPRARVWHEQVLPNVHLLLCLGGS